MIEIFHGNSILEQRTRIEWCFSHGKPFIIRKFVHDESDFRNLHSHAFEHSAKLNPTNYYQHYKTGDFVREFQLRGLDFFSSPQLTKYIGSSRLIANISPEFTSLHYDAAFNSVFALCTIGEKRWTIAPASLKEDVLALAPSAHVALGLTVEDVHASCFEVNQSAGDLIYLPPYYYHSVKYDTIGVTIDLSFIQDNLLDNISRLSLFRTQVGLRTYFQVVLNCQASLWERVFARTVHIVFFCLELLFKFRKYQKFRKFVKYGGTNSAVSDVVTRTLKFYHNLNKDL